MKSLYFLLTLIFTHQFYAQGTTKIDTADYQKRKSFLINYKEKSKAFNKALSKKYEGEELRELNKIFSALQKSLTEDVNDKMFLFDDRFINFIKDKIAILTKYNTDINTDFNILVAKDNEPNAFNFGENTLVVNLGLFAFLSNEDQFVSILAHEIAHAKLNHTVNRVIAKVNDDLSKKEEVSSIKKAKNQSDKAFELFKSTLYSNRKIRRQNEMAADSLGYEYYKKTDFQKTAFTSALQSLKTFDDQKPDSLSLDIYKKTFDLPKQKFKEDWLKMDDFSRYNYKLYKNKISEDSLKTHPDLISRIDWLKNRYLDLKSDQKMADATTDFLELSQIAKDRLIPNYYDTEKYGLGIYSCLAILEEKPDDFIVKEYLGKLFTKIYEARKSYNLNRYLDKVEPKNQSQSYQQFLSFMWNLNLDEIKNIADYYKNSGN